MPGPPQRPKSLAEQPPRIGSVVTAHGGCVLAIDGAHELVAAFGQQLGETARRGPVERGGERSSGAPSPPGNRRRRPDDPRRLPRHPAQAHRNNKAESLWSTASQVIPNLLTPPASSEWRETSNSWPPLRWCRAFRRWRAAAAPDSGATQIPFARAASDRSERR